MTNTSKYLILGGGQQGQVVASKLVEDGSKVTLADFRKDIKLDDPRIKVEYFNAKDVEGEYRNVLGAWFAQHDVVVSCLPSQFGGPCVELAAEFGTNYVDLSYTTDNLFLLGPLAKHTGSTIITDCGLAPGLPNMIAGYFLGKHASSPGEKCPEIDIYVGGVAKDQSLPLGYVETWSLEDLYEEYVRMGRYVKDGKEVEVSPTDLGALRTVNFEGQDFEAFTSDGLRTLLAFKNVGPNMREWTLRYPGHMQEVKTLLYPRSATKPVSKKQFVEQFRGELARSAQQGGDAADRVVLFVDCAGERFRLEVEGTPEITAMAKTTAYTCATMAQFLALESSFAQPHQIDRGVMSMELIGREPNYFKKVLKSLEEKGVKFTQTIQKGDGFELCGF